MNACMFECMYICTHGIILGLIVWMNSKSSNSHQLLLLGLDLNLQLTTCTLSLRELSLLRYLYIENQAIQRISIILKYNYISVYMCISACLYVF